MNFLVCTKKYVSFMNVDVSSLVCRSSVFLYVVVSKRTFSSVTFIVCGRLSDSVAVTRMFLR